MRRIKRTGKNKLKKSIPTIGKNTFLKPRETHNISIYAITKHLLRKIIYLR